MDLDVNYLPNHIIFQVAMPDVLEVIVCRIIMFIDYSEAAAQF